MSEDLSSENLFLQIHKVQIFYKYRKESEREREKEMQCKKKGLFDIPVNNCSSRYEINRASRYKSIASNAF